MTSKKKVSWRMDLPPARDAAARACPECGLVVLAGRHSEHLEHAAVTDVWLLTRPLERAALLLGRRTYRVWRSSRDRPLLHRRDRWSIAATWPPELRVVADHVCGQPLRTDRSALDFARPALPDHPPF